MIAQLSFFGLISAKKTDAKSFVSNGILTNSLLCQSWPFAKTFAKKSILVQLMFNICHADNIEKG